MTAATAPFDWRRHWLTALVTVGGLVVTAIMVGLLRDIEADREQARVVRQANVYRDAIHDRLILVEERLLAVRSLFGSQETVGADQFTDFVQPLLDTRVAVQAVEWVAREHDAARGDAHDRFPVRFIEPFVAAAPAIGADLGGNPVVRQTLEMARDKGVLSATPPLQLAPSELHESVMLVLVPAFPAHQSIDSPAERRAALKGFVLGVVRIDPLMRIALGGTDDEAFDIVLRDTRTAGILATRLGEGSEAQAVLAATDRLALPIDFGGQAWEVVVAGRTRAAITPEAIPVSWLALALGLTATLSAVLIVNFLQQARLRATGQVARRTADLQRSQIALGESRERLQLALDGARMWAWDWDVASDRLVWTSPPDGLLGPGSADGYGDFRELVVPEDKPAFLAAGRAALATDTHYACEFRIRRTDGRIAWLSASGVVMRKADGTPERMIGVSQDITERVAAENTLRDARDAAESASRAKSEFLSTMSHEIRTPMNGVLGMAELLRLSGLSAEQTGYLDTLTDCGQDLLRILNDILDYSRLETGRVDLAAAPFDPAAALHEACDPLQPKAGEKGLTLATSIPDGMPALVGDVVRLRQVVGKLVENAIKFTPSGAVNIVAECKVGAGGTARLEVGVRDTGVGIPPEAMDRLFQPFSQGDGSATRRFGGTGLGLAICRRFVNAVGGTISVRSEPGKGSEFRVAIDFPVADPAVPVARSHGTGDAVLDLAALHRVTDAVGIPPADLIAIFVEETRRQLDRMADSARTGDHAALRRDAASIKSAAAEVGAIRLGTLARTLEDASGNAVPADIADRLAALEAAFSAYSAAATEAFSPA